MVINLYKATIFLHTFFIRNLALAGGFKFLSWALILRANVVLAVSDAKFEEKDSF